LVIRTFTERADTRVKEDKGDWDWIEVTCLFGEIPFRVKTSLFYAEQSVTGQTIILQFLLLVRLEP